MMKRAISYQLSAISRALIPASPRLRVSASARRGFTLIELLVVMSIIAVLATITFAGYRGATKGDRISAAARQVQSYVEGARDRAIHAGEPRGVRFLLDPNTTDPLPPNTASSMVFIGAPERFSSGSIQIAAALTITFPVPPNPPWESLRARGLLVDGARLKATAGSRDEYFHVAWDDTAVAWRVTRAPSAPMDFLDVPLEYELSLQPAVLPNQEPRLMARNVVIDLDHSWLPNDWTTPTWSDHMDVMFSPRGTIVGELASTGLVHLLLAETVDVEAVPPRDPTDPLREGNQRIVTITPQTGNVSAHEVNLDATLTNPPLPYYFYYARTGALAK